MDILKFKLPWVPRKELEESEQSMEELRGVNIANEHQLEFLKIKDAELAEKLKEAQETVATILERYEKDVRVGIVRISTAEIQARCRTLVGNVKVEGPAEPQLWVIKADKALPEKSINAIRAQLFAAVELDIS